MFASIFMKSVSELRQDIVSGDWIVVATGRAKRPHEFLKVRRPAFHQPKRTCPFEKLEKGVLLFYDSDGGTKTHEWWVEVVKNKYPAFAKHGVCALGHPVGIYHITDGVGFHEVVITRDHERSLAVMSDEEAELVMRAYVERYQTLKNDSCVAYISIFHNHGRQSGASITHPHSQIIAIPVIPPDVRRSLQGSADYFHKHKTCVHCMVIEYELREKTRVVYTNDHFLVFAPYASHSAFELRVSPRVHSPHFEDMSDTMRRSCANALRVGLAKLYKGLQNPDYNFFLHTAPTHDSKEFHHYHWHFEILPKTAIWAGFEIGTGIEISAIAPEKAAEFLRKIKI